MRAAPFFLRCAELRHVHRTGYRSPAHVCGTVGSPHAAFVRSSPAPHSAPRLLDLLATPFLNLETGCPMARPRPGITPGRILLNLVAVHIRGPGLHLSGVEHGAAGPTAATSARMKVMTQSNGGGNNDISSRVERTLERCLEWSQQGRHRRVLSEVQRLLALARNDSLLTSQLLNWKAQALLAMGCADRALPAASRSWALRSSPHACHLMASALHAVGDCDQSEDMLRMGTELFPEAVHLPMQLAMMMADQGRLPEAIDVLDRVAPAHQLPDEMQVFLAGLRANLLATVGRWTEADSVLRDGLGRHPDSPLLIEAHDSLCRQWSRTRAEDRLAASWRRTLDDIDDVPAEVDESVIRCGSLMELSDLTVLAARRLWRAFLERESVRVQSPEPWAAALVLAALEVDGRPASAAAVARAMSVRPTTVRSALRRLRSYLSEQDVELVRRAFGSLSNPRLDQPLSDRAISAEVIRFPDR